MTEIFLIRHAQAEGNIYRIMQGHWDGNVTEQGWQQIEALSARFRDIPVDAVYSSDSYRTRMTASAVTCHKALPLHTDKRLRELNMGSWETEFYGNLAHQYPEQMELFLAHPHKWRVAGAETYAQVCQRAMAVLTELLASHEGQSIALVSHGVTIRCLMSRILRLPLEEIEDLPIFGNTAVSHVFYDNGSFRVDYMNDQSHLKNMKLPHWGHNNTLRHEAIDPAQEAAYYCACYEKTWLLAHRSLQGFRASPYLESAIQHHQEDEEAVLRLYNGEEVVGLVDLDTRRGAESGIGWISFLYLDENYRGKGYGVQLLARAIMKYTAMGRTRLQLTVAQDNQQAREFYARHGFQQVDSRKNALGTLLVLEKKLGVKKYA